MFLIIFLVFLIITIIIGAVISVLYIIKKSPSTNPPSTNPPSTNPPSTNPPSTNPPSTNPPSTNPPSTNPPSTNPPSTNPPTSLININNPTINNGYIQGENINCFTGTTLQNAGITCSNNAECKGFAYKKDITGSGCYKKNLNNRLVQDNDYNGYYLPSITIPSLPNIIGIACEDSAYNVGRFIDAFDLSYGWSSNGAMPATQFKVCIINNNSNPPYPNCNNSVILSHPGRHTYNGPKLFVQFDEKVTIQNLGAIVYAKNVNTGNVWKSVSGETPLVLNQRYIYIDTTNTPGSIEPTPPPTSAPVTYSWEKTGIVDINGNQPLTGCYWYDSFPRIYDKNIYDDQCNYDSDARSFGVNDNSFVWRHEGGQKDNCPARQDRMRCRMFRCKGSDGNYKDYREFCKFPTPAL